MNLNISQTEKVPSSEVSTTFLQRMVDAMGLSFFKYGRVVDAYPIRVDAIASLKLRLAKYEETGNGEFLVDVANFAMIETMCPRHPKYHYAGSDKSPGRVWASGQTTEEANTVSQENVRRGGSHMRTDGGFYKKEGD